MSPKFPSDVEFDPNASYALFEDAIKRWPGKTPAPLVEPFLKAVLSTSENRTNRLKTGTRLWRARLGFESRPGIIGGAYFQRWPQPYTKVGMKPDPMCVREGRANPEGVTYLYLATDHDTAISEVRPSKGAIVSVCQCEILKDLKMLDCTEDHLKPPNYREVLHPEEREQRIWWDIDVAFARPVDRGDSTKDYEPTQVIAKRLKEHGGFDGIIYRSSLGKGKNAVLFDPDMAEMIEPRCLFRVVDIIVVSELAGP